MRDEILRQEYDERNMDYDGEGAWFVKEKTKGPDGGGAERGNSYEYSAGSKKGDKRAALWKKR